MTIFKKINITLYIIIFLLTAVFLPKQANAGFGISPSDIVRDNLKPGNVIEKKFVISRVDANEELIIKVEPELDGMEDWFSFKPSTEFEFPAGQQRAEVTAVITVPNDAVLDKFSGSIRFTASPKELPAGGVNIVKGARVQVELITSGEDVTDLLIRDLDIEDVEEGNNVVVSLKVENLGNVPAAPTRATLKVSDLVKNPVNVFETTDMADVAVGATEDITATFNTNLEPGEYFGNVRVYLDENLLREEDIYFRITEKPEQEEVVTNTVTTLQTASCCTDPFIQSSTPKALLTLAVVLFILILIFLLLKKKKDTKWISPLLFFLSTVLILTVFSLLGLYYLYSRGINVMSLVTEENVVYAPVIYTKEEVPIEQVVEVVEEDQSPVENSGVAGTSEVRGISTVAENVDFGVQVVEPNKSTLQVVALQSEGIYNVYAKKDTGSEILYTAQSGETLNVTNETNDWYEVTLSDGRVGWLQKQSVQSSN